MFCIFFEPGIIFLWHHLLCYYNSDSQELTCTLGSNAAFTEAGIEAKNIFKPLKSATQPGCIAVMLPG